MQFSLSRFLLIASKLEDRKRIYNLVIIYVRITTSNKGLNGVKGTVQLESDRQKHAPQRPEGRCQKLHIPHSKVNSKLYFKLHIFQ
jgi:hypothetical protein